MTTYSEPMILTPVEQSANMHDIFLSPQNLSCSKCVANFVKVFRLIKLEFTQACDNKCCKLLSIASLNPSSTKMSVI